MDGSPGPIRYTTSQGFSIAWQEFGGGPVDIALVWGNPNHLEALWDWPSVATFLRGVGQLGRVVHLDQRGSGLSDRVPIEDLPDLADRVRDVLAVLDAAGMSRVTLIGESEGAACAVRLAATHPDRVTNLILLAPTLGSHIPEEFRDETLDLIETNWGEPTLIELLFPGEADDPRFRDFWAKFLRLSASPSEARAMLVMDQDIDERVTLAGVEAPTLLLSHEEDPFVPADDLARSAALLPNGRLVLFPGYGRTFGLGKSDDEALSTMAEFLGQHPSAGTHADRRRRAILFTDIVGSTALVSEIGDEAWRELLDRHDRIMSQIVRAKGGDRIESTGDGIVAVFRQSGDAIRAANDAHAQIAALDIEIRAGVHIGDVQLRGSAIAGIDVHIAARIADKADAGEVLISEQVVESLGGQSALSSTGTHELKGVPGNWHLWAIG